MRKPKETSLRFTDEQVRGILKGEQTYLSFPATGDFYNMFTEAIRTCPQLLRPKYIVGDTIRVREAWCCEMDGGCNVYDEAGDYVYLYRATETRPIMAEDADGGMAYTKNGMEASPWQSSSRMPRAATRAKLQITNVRSEPAGLAWNLCYDYKLILL